MLSQQAIRASGRLLARRSPVSRRFAHHDSHGHAAPAEEKFSKGFFISIAAFVGILAAYKMEQSMSAGGKNGLTRLIESYADLEEIWKERNERHTKLVEQAGKDRSLFQDSRPSQTIPIMMLENFNHGSPFNNEAGRAGGDLRELKRKLSGETA